jgi:hypothetical protein
MCLREAKKNIPFSPQGKNFILRIIKGKKLFWTRFTLYDKKYYRH